MYFYFFFLRIGVAFTGISGDIMEIQTLGKSERFVGKVHYKRQPVKHFFLLLSDNQLILFWYFIFNK